MRRIDISEREVRRLYLKEKLTTYQIADKFNCCQATIWKRLHQFGIKPRKSNELYSNVPSKKELKKLYLKKKLSTWDIEKYGYSRGSVYRKLREYGIPVRTLAKSHIIHPRKSFSGNPIEKAYLIGFSLGDLRVRKGYKNSETISVECGTTKEEQLKLIKELFQNYGKVWITKPNKRGARNIGVNLDLTFSFLLEKSVPEWILQNKKYFFSFLAGFTDAEGHIGINKGLAVYQLGNYDNELLFIIYEKLVKFGIMCRKPYCDHTKGYVTKDGYKHKQDYWHLIIGRKFHLLKLFDLIEPYLRHEKKVNDLNKSRRNIIERNRKFGNLIMRPNWR